MTEPYADAARMYWNAGWRGILPLPPGKKAPVPKGWTGHDGKTPSYPDIEAWCEDHPNSNIALRFPAGVIGIDVDAYGDKLGRATLQHLEQKYGTLPATWRSSARPAPSGIYLFRVPVDRAWPGDIGPNIEIVQHVHRYACVWPSHNPDADACYRWYSPTGVQTDYAVPRVGDIPLLPDTWIEGLSSGNYQRENKLAVGNADAWLRQWQYDGSCRLMRGALERIERDFLTGSRHEVLTRSLLAVLRLGEQGHRDMRGIIHAIRAAFELSTAQPGRGAARTPEQLEGEWTRALDGAIGLVTGQPSRPAGAGPALPCVCDDRIADLMPLERPAEADPAVTTLGDPVEAAYGEMRAENLEGTSSGTRTDEVEHTTWWPRDLAPVLTGENAEPEPCVLARDDKKCLFYAGKVNGLLGESESGKTWLLLEGVAQELAAGHKVLYLDFEDSVEGITRRLLTLGVPRESLEPDAGLFTYIAPEENLNASAQLDFSEVVERAEYTLVAVDGVNAAMTLLGLDLMSNTDATKFSQAILKPIASRGPAVVAVDHLPKDKESRGKGGIGAQAKRAMITGSAITVDVLEPFGLGATGKLRLTVDKDRAGHVRGYANYAKNVGTAVLTSNAATGRMTVVIDHTAGNSEDAAGGTFRPTGVMVKVSHYLSTVNGPVSRNAIEQGVTGRANVIRAALEHLVKEGYVSRESGARGAVLHAHIKRYSELLDQITTDETDESQQ